jgi:hypothetical protein
MRFNLVSCHSTCDMFILRKNIYIYSVMSNSTHSMGMGFPDFNGCYISRSPLQSFLEVQEWWFCVCPCHDQRSTFCWNSRFWSSSVSLTSAEGTLFGYLWANVKNERTVSTHWIITCQIWQCECWSIQVCIEGCQFGCLWSPGKTPWRQNGRATWKSWTCWWIEPFGCTVAQGWRRNPLKLLALVGWNVSQSGVG